MRQITRLFHNAIQKYFGILPLIQRKLESCAGFRWIWPCLRCCSQPKRTEPLKTVTPARSIVMNKTYSGINKPRCRPDSEAPLEPAWTTGTHRGGVGCDCTDCHAKAWILIRFHPLCFHIQSTNLNEPVYYVTGFQS